MDTREPVDICWQLQEQGFEVSRVTMDSGDYLWVTHDNRAVAVERKTGSDFLHSIGGRQANGRPRLINQLLRMRETYDISILLIEGQFYPIDAETVMVSGRTRKWRWDAIDNLFLTVQQSGTHVAFCAKGHLGNRIRSLQGYFDKTKHLLPPG